MSAIHVCSLEALPETAARLRPGRVISLLQPEWQPETPHPVAPEHHHRVVINDITEASEDQILPERHHVEAVIAFLEKSRDASLLVHCFAGISRSPAVALMALVLDAPGREAEGAQLLRQAADYAKPNRLLIRYADEILGREGRLISAVEAMGPAADPLPDRPGIALPRSL